MTLPDAEAISRSVLLLTNTGQAASFEQAAATLAAETIVIVAGPECATSPGHQAALLTAANTARRAVGVVPVVAPSEVLDAKMFDGTMRGMTIAAALDRVRATPTDSLPASQHPALAIGNTRDIPARALRVTWNGWVAALFTDQTTRLNEDNAMVLAPIAAAALGVSEAFQSLRGHLEAGSREIALSLWNPDADDAFAAQGPPVEWLPRELAIVGLGHLGQAYGWCLAHLPYADPTKVFVLLQDTDIVTKATLSTGLLTFDGTLNVKKTRVVARELESAGITTSLIERRLTAEDRVRAGDPQLALIGVDNVDTRRILSDIGWHLCVDAGLGRRGTNYTSIRLQAFPGPQRSDKVAAWLARPTSSDDVLTRAAYEALEKDGVDECGLLTIADKAVAVTFVGTLAACLAVSEPLRALHGGARLGIQTINLSVPHRVKFASTVTGSWLPPALPCR